MESIKSIVMYFYPSDTDKRIYIHKAIELEGFLTKDLALKEVRKRDVHRPIYIEYVRWRS